MIIFENRHPARIRSGAGFFGDHALGGNKFLDRLVPIGHSGFLRAPDLSQSGNIVV
jgi:hypothetical protein